MKFTGIVLCILTFGLNVLHAQPNVDDCIFKPEDKRLAEAKLSTFSVKASLPVTELISEIGLSFLGTPYVAATLENGVEEKLVVNLRELDCTTFAETCLALARTIKLGKTDFETYISELERLRYRDGVRHQYLSRLHYFSEWIHNNAEKKIISEEPNLQGVKSDKAINFMSTHPNSYPVLKAHPELIPALSVLEKEVTAAGFYYFPKDNPENLLKNLKQGDIIALTSAIEGIDVNHVGIIILRNNRFHLLHASQSGEKVVLSEGPITDFIKPESKNAGIIIARPVF